MKTEGIVISEIDYKETSKIVNLYTPLGKVGVKALGSKKVKNGLLGFTTTGNIVSFVSNDSTLPTLIEYSIIDSMYNKLDDLNTIKSLGVIIDIINQLPEDINHNATYEFIKSILISLDKNPKKSLCIFLIKILYSFGVAPNLKSCVICGKTDLAYLDINLGGALCKDHHVVDDTNLNIFKEYYFNKGGLESFNDYDFDSLIKLIKKYYAFHLGIKIKYEP